MLPSLRRCTWTIKTFKRTPRTPIAAEVAAITAGPTKNLTAMESATMDLPQAMSFGCKAMNRPGTQIITGWSSLAKIKIK